MSGFNVSQPGARMVYAAAKTEMAKANVSQDQSILAQSELRLEIVLNTTTTNYNIPVLINQQPSVQAPTENRLKLQDSFFIGSIGFFLGVQTGPNDFSYPLWTYPSLSGALFTSATQRPLGALYNGYMSLTVNNRVLIPYWDMWKHYKVNQTQAGVGVTAETIFPTDQLDLSADGFFPVEPNVVQIGSTNNIMQLFLPQAISALPAAPNVVRLVCIMRGILAQNCTSVTNS